MLLTNYIDELLYRYDCVIVPDFGGFVTTVISSKADSFSHTFHPPTKQITFNSHLKNNDGLLANYIAHSENISFEKATEKISLTVKNWKQQLKTESLALKKIGNISLNKEQKLTFEPDKTTNYLTKSFGLSSFSSPAIKRSEERKKHIKNSAPVVSRSKEVSSFLKYVATVAIFLVLGSLSNNYNQHQENEIVTSSQETVKQKIQSATFAVENPLPTIELNLTKEKITNFYIMAGAFRVEANAEKKLLQLKSKGFDAEILGKNKWNLTLVSFHSLHTREEALKSLKTIRKKYSKEAWLLVKTDK